MLCRNGKQCYLRRHRPGKVEKLSKGEITIYEPASKKYSSAIRKEGRLHFTTSLKEGIEGARIIFLALPAPGRDGSADLNTSWGGGDLGKLITEYVVIVDKSTVPVGTAERYMPPSRKTPKVDFDVVSNPEFLREGVAVDDFMKPDRVVIGTGSENQENNERTLRPPSFARETHLIHGRTQRRTHQVRRNSFLAMKITFMNEVAQLCERLGADVDMVRKGIGSDERIGKRFSSRASVTAEAVSPKMYRPCLGRPGEAQYDFRILDAVMDVNENRKRTSSRK